MGLGSQCQRALLRVASRRQCVIPKLLAFFFLLTIVGIRVFHSPGPQLVQSSDLNSQLLPARSAAAEPLDVFVVSPAEESGVVLLRDSGVSVTVERDELLIMDTSKYNRLANVKSVLQEKREKSRSRPLLAETGVLSPKAIRIVPTKPVVREGDPLLLTCAVIDSRSISNSDAPYLNFELPEMSHELESNVLLFFINGMATLRIVTVKKGHEGVYKCYSQNQNSELKYNTVEVRVTERDDDGDGRSLRKHTIFLSKENEVSRVEENDLSALLEQGKIQQKQVDLFCKTHNLSQQALQLPGETEGDTECLYRHLLLNDKTNTMFCFVPKAGCTNLRVLFFMAQGMVPRSQLQASRDKVNQELLEGVQFSQSFLSRSNTQRSFVLNRYFKFMMYRDPLERLLSGYRSKVERFPLIGLDDDTPHYNWLRKAVYSETHPLLYEEYVRNEGAKGVNISFSDFIDFWLTRPKSLQIDEHFRSIFSLCQPCRVRFDFYGNFNNFNTDSEVLIHKIHSSSKFLRQGYYSSDESTGALTRRYYSQLSKTQRVKVVELLRQDLNFYYHLFPHEETENKSILGL